MRTHLLLATCLASSMFGCSDQPQVLVDTSGARFDWRCAKGVCELGLLPETPSPLPCPQGHASDYSFSKGRFVEVHSVCNNPTQDLWSAELGDGRYLACEVDDDCPQLDFFASPALYECSAGLCQNVDTDRYPRDTITMMEAVPLCIAELPRGTGVPAEIDTLLAEQCGLGLSDACELPLPEPCWQP